MLLSKHKKSNDLNILGSFREGNGRVQKLFLALLIKNARYKFNFSQIDKDLLMISTIKSVSGDIFLLKDYKRKCYKIKANKRV